MPFRTDRSLPMLAVVAAIAYAGHRDAGAHAKPSSHLACSMGIVPGGRDTLTNTLLLGRATRDTVPVSGNVVDRWIWPRRDRTLYGQVVRMDSMLGPAADPTRRALRKRRSVDVVIVPWGNTSGCGIDVWRYSALWTTPDSSGLYSVRLRAESLWASGRPTFDAFYAANYSYVIGPFTAGPHFAGYDATGPKFHDNSMTPAELFSLYAVLSNIKGPRDSLGRGRARAWVRANRVETKFPADLILPRWSLDQRR